MKSLYDHVRVSTVVCIAREATSFLSNVRHLIALNCREGQLTEHYRQVKKSKVH
jgi:hypothetical protein